MQTLELPLFNQEYLDTKPLNNSIAATIPQPPPTLPDLQQDANTNPYKSLENLLNNLLPDSKEENKINKARRILGERAKDLSDQQIETFVTELQYLADCWLDVFERQAFNGQTLQEVLRAK